MKRTLPILIATVLGALAFATAQVTKKEQQVLTPDRILAELMAGNSKFVAGEISDVDIIAGIKATSEGQHPKAMILSCIDSRVPIELVFDQGIGDIFVGRVAGNIENEDQLGSMEFATKLAGAKLVMVLGHSGCGAVKGSIDNAQLGNLSALLAKIRPAVNAVEGFKPEERTSANQKFVKEVTAQNVRQTVADIRKDSPVLANLEKSGQIKIVGAIYDIRSGKVTLLD